MPAAETTVGRDAGARTRSILRYVARRLPIAIGTLFFVSIVTFVATVVIPNDPARLALGRAATPAQLEQYREQQGLDEPPVKRYVEWISGFVTGDWGTSTRNRREVKSDVLPRLWRSMTVALVAMLIAVPLAFLIGTWLGRRAGTKTDVSSSIGLLLVNSLPEFVIALLMLLVFGVWLGVLPVTSAGAIFASGWAQIEAYILPILTLVAVVTPYMARMVRVQVRDSLGQGWVRSAVLRGVGTRRLTWRHIVPNASVPVVNVVALNIAELLGGLVVVEVVFAFPGLGQLLVDSVLGSDIPTVQAIALISALGFVIVNSLADLAVAALNPRLRTGGR